MINKFVSLENNDFVLNGETFVCKDCPKGLKFSLAELDKMEDSVFLQTMKEHEKLHPIKFKPVFKANKPEEKKVEEKPKAKKEVSQKEPATPATTNDAAKKEQTQMSLPAIPQKLLDAGFKKILLAPQQAFIAAGGKKEQFVREINYSIQALMNNDTLLESAKQFPDFFIEAIKNVGLAGLTLSPELKLGYLVPRKGKVYFTSSYMGKSEIITRAGVVKKIKVNLVYEGEKFEIKEGTKPEIIHIPDPWVKKTMETLKGGYCIFFYTNGEVWFDTMSKDRIQEIRDIYSEAYKAKKGYAPWEHEGEAIEMARKTILNWAFKFAPKTGLTKQQISALEVTGEYDREVMNEHYKTPENQKADQYAEDGPAESTYTDAQIVD